jgi:hypothetical protein
LSIWLLPVAVVAVVLRAVVVVRVDTERPAGLRLLLALL